MLKNSKSQKRSEFWIGGHYYSSFNETLFCIALNYIEITFGCPLFCTPKYYLALQRARHWIKGQLGRKKRNRSIFCHLLLHHHINHDFHQNNFVTMITISNLLPYYSEQETESKGKMRKEKFTGNKVLDTFSDEKIVCLSCDLQSSFFTIL